LRLPLEQDEKTTIQGLAEPQHSPSFCLPDTPSRLLRRHDLADPDTPALVASPHVQKYAPGSLPRPVMPGRSAPLTYRRSHGEKIGLTRPSHNEMKPKWKDRCVYKAFSTQQSRANHCVVRQFSSSRTQSTLRAKIASLLMLHPELAGEKVGLTPEQEVGAQRSHQARAVFLCPQNLQMRLHLGQGRG